MSGTLSGTGDTTGENRPKKKKKRDNIGSFPSVSDLLGRN